MKLIEYRIFMPLNVDENKIGQLWSMAEVSRLNTSGGEGVEILKNESFLLPTNFDELTKYLPDFDANDVSKTSSHHHHKSKKIQTSKSLNIFPKYSQQDSSENGNHDTNHNSSKKSEEKVNSNGESNSSAKHNIGGSNTDITAFSSMPDSTSSSSSVENLTTKFDKTSINPASSCESISKDGQTRKGQYMYKVYKIASKFPWFFRKILPRELSILYEKSWNIYPISKTHIRNEYMKDKFHVFINTITKDCVNGVVEENVHNLTPEQLDKREIIVIDISEPVSNKEYIASEDPTTFHSVKANRGPLKQGWINTHRPLVCCYKLVELEFKWFGFQGQAEGYMVGFYKKLFKKFHRQIFCWMDKWYDLKIEDVRRYERELENVLRENINKGEVVDNPFEE